MGQHDVGIALERVVIVLAEAGALLRRPEERPSLVDHTGGVHGGGGLVGVEHFVDPYDQLGDAMQPREPVVADHELEEFAGRGDPAAVVPLVRFALGVKQGFVQSQQSVSQIDQTLPGQIRVGAQWNHGGFPPSV